MFLSAFGASKPIGPGNDPSYSSVQFLQTFDSLIPGTLPEPFVSEKSGTQWINIDPPNDTMQVVSSPARFGNAGLILVSVSGRTVWLQGSEMTGDFTFEFSMLDSTGFRFPLSDFSGVGQYFTLQKESTFGAFAFQVSGVGEITTNVVPSTNTWYDFAIARSGSLIRVFINGIQRCSFTLAGGIGSWTLASTDWVMDDIRISNVCRYTANYTPSHPFPTQ